MSIIIPYFTIVIPFHILCERDRLIDYSSPGLEQIGTVWLPLPHLMLLPFSLVDLLFKTGLAGTFISLPSIAIAAAYHLQDYKSTNKCFVDSRFGIMSVFFEP